MEKRMYNLAVGVFVFVMALYILCGILYIATYL